MFTILDTIVDGALATTHFACDLGACKGACCTTPGGRGAPLNDEEVALVVDAIPAAAKYLAPRNISVIELRGAVEGRPGNYATRCIDRRDCVFVYYDNDVAKCAIERAYFNGETTFRKPISCHLFPIRVENLFDGQYLRYERISECNPALAKGAATGEPLYRFLSEAITRAFGDDFHRELVKALESNLKKKGPAKE